MIFQDHQSKRMVVHSDLSFVFEWRPWPFACMYCETAWRNLRSLKLVNQDEVQCNSGPR